MKLTINHCQLGRDHMLEKIAYDYVTELKVAKDKAAVKTEMAKRSKQYSDDEKTKLREFINKWLTK